MAWISAFGKLDPATYQRSSLHADDRIWVEKNCYIDLWIELLHALGHQPRALLPFTLAIDFAGDQWTFYKPSHEDIRQLYGIDVQELSIWRPLLEHLVEHMTAGKLVSTEADAYWLPDTAGTDYHQKHTKTTIVVAAIDVAERQLQYFHNAGLYFLQGADFTQLFRLDAEVPADHMPLFAELLRIDRQIHLVPSELATRSFELLRRTVSRIPTINPIVEFQKRFEADLPIAQTLGMDYYHAWAFNTIRQLGSAFELAAESLAWLTTQELGDFGDSVAACRRIATANKTLILKAARAVNSRKTIDCSSIFMDQQQAWEDAVGNLRSGFGVAI